MTYRILSRRDIFRLGALGFAASIGKGWASPTLHRAPYLQSIGERRASLLWTTLDSGDGAVFITSPDGDSRVIPARRRVFEPSVTQLPFPFYQHQADLTGLSPSTRYTYQVAMNGDALTPAANSFRTAGPGDFSFLVFGDSGDSSTEQAGLVARMRREANTAFALHTGDLAYPAGDFAQFESNYFRLNAPLMGSMAFFATPGNHDYLSARGHPFLSGHQAPECSVPVPADDQGRYYAFDWGSVHFATLDSNLLETDRAQPMLNWLAADLAATGKFWKILMVHHTPYPTGHHLEDAVCALVRERVTPLVERFGVQLVLAGHEHGYERTVSLRGGIAAAAGHGTTYITSGGGGAGLHPVSMTSQSAAAISAHHYLRIDVRGGALGVQSIDEQGREIDRLLLEPRPVVFTGGVVRAADFSPRLTAGRPAAIFGQNLALETTLSAKPGETQLSGTRVTLGQWDLPLIYCSPGQLNVELPPQASGLLPLRVFTPNGSAAIEVPVSS